MTPIITLISSQIFDSTIWKILATSVSIICLIALNVQAAPILVTNDNGDGSLRQALANANDGDAISFGVTRTINLRTGELILDKSVTITGSSNPAVDANFPSRVFYTSSGVNACHQQLSL